MYTVDDALFAMLHSCSEQLSSNRLVSYMYMYQLAGLDYQFRYQIASSGIKARSINSFLNAVINEDKLEVIDGIVRLTTLGELYYTSVPLTYAEWEKINDIKSCLDSLSDEELYFVVLTDIVVSDTLKTYGVEGLMSQRTRITTTLSNLSREYSDENFDSALKIIRKVKEGFDNE